MFGHIAKKVSGRMLEEMKSRMRHRCVAVGPGACVSLSLSLSPSRCVSVSLCFCVCVCVRSSVRRLHSCRYSIHVCAASLPPSLLHPR
jgi:hypothetical protein